MSSEVRPKGMKRSLTLTVFFAALVAVCVLVTLLSLRLFQPSEWAHDEPHGHQWLHEQLGLTEQEMTAIDAFEDPYRAERQRLQTALDERIEAIAKLLQEHDAFAPEINAAIHDLHVVHAELQQLAIEHYFEMLSVLPPEKQDKLRALAVEALSTPQ